MVDGDREMLVSVNPLGYAITLNDVERILYPVSVIDKTESDNVAHFFHLSHDKLCVPLVERYAKACECMTNVSVASHDRDIKIKLVESLCGAKRCYCFAEFLACIELCALHGEMLANYLCITSKDSLSQHNIIATLDKDVRDSVNKHLVKDNFYDYLNQKHRLSWLLAGSVLQHDDHEDLSTIHNTRIYYFHHWNAEHGAIENQSLECLKLISKVSAKYMEVLDSEENVSRIKAYLSKHHLPKGD